MQTVEKPEANKASSVPWYKDPVSAYDLWTQDQGIPIHEGYVIPDLRAVELGRWPARDCDAAFLKLAGQEGVSEVRVSELGPGQTLPRQKFGFDELVYVVEGRGLTTVQRQKDGPSVSFEWQTHSMFLLPRHYYHQLSNAQGTRPARLLHYNYLPFVMDAIPDISFYLDNPHGAALDDPGWMTDLYAEASSTESGRPNGATRVLWKGNFFPDMLVWDKFTTGDMRGFASQLVGMRFPGSPITSHMAVFEPLTYKKAHRHGPGVVIVVLAGEGFSVMWQDDSEKEYLTWQAGSAFVPPARWFHQHFNVGDKPARYLALHSAPSILGYGENVEDLARDQIEYSAEDPRIRQTFAAKLAERGLKSGMPDSLYQ